MGSVQHTLGTTARPKVIGKRKVVRSAYSGSGGTDPRTVGTALHVASSADCREYCV